MRSILLGMFCAAGVASQAAADVATAPATVDDASLERRIMSHIEGYWGQFEIHPRGSIEGGDFSPGRDFDVAGVAARMNFPVHEYWNFQVDGSVDNIFDASRFDGFEELPNRTVDLTSYGGAAHLYWRNQAFALGVFGGWQRYGTTGVGEIPAGPENSDLFYRSFDNDVVQAGPEAQAYFGNMTLYGQAYIGQRIARSTGGFGDATDVQNLDLWGARAVVRYFPIANLRLETEVGYSEQKLNEDLDFTANTWRFAAQGTFRFDQVPVSLFARYQYENPFNEGGDIFGVQPTDSHRLLIGARLSFGSESLLDEDRNGPTMDVVQRNSQFRR